MPWTTEDLETLQKNFKALQIKEAAPQLLEALKAIVAANEVLYGKKMQACRSRRGFVCDGMDLIPIMKAHDKARAAIAVAEGDG